MDVFMVPSKDDNLWELIIPDGVKLHANLAAYYPNLKKISMSIKDYVPIESFFGDGIETFNKTKASSVEVELRMPLKGSIIKTDKIQKVIDRVTGLYGKMQETPPVHTLFFVYDLASRAWYEDLTMLCLVQPGLSDGLFSIDDIKDVVTPTVLYMVKILSVKHENAYELAEIILENLLIRDYYNLLETVSKEYGFKWNDELNEALRHIEDYDIDLGQHLTVKIDTIGSVIHGFDGSGILTGCKYNIAGNSTYEMNQEIIRITSGEIDASEGHNDFMNKTHFDFLKQRWFERDGKIGGLWSYPNGTIHGEGIVDNGVTVVSVIIEMGLLAKEFPGLDMDVNFWAPNANYIQTSRGTEFITISINHGEVSACFAGNYHDAKTLDTIPPCKVDYQGMQKKKMKLLSDDYIQQIAHKNDMEKEAKCAEGELISKLLQIGGYKVGHVLEHYINKNLNWHICEADFVSKRHGLNSILALITFDNAKIDKYLEENKRN